MVLNMTKRKDLKRKWVLAMRKSKSKRKTFSDDKDQLIIANKTFSDDKRLWQTMVASGFPVA